MLIKTQRFYRGACQRSGRAEHNSSRWSPMNGCLRMYPEKQDQSSELKLIPLQS